MKRTDNELFYNCPICKKKPFVYTNGINSGIVKCSGPTFNKHKEQMINVVYEQPSQLLKTLSIEWNKLISS